MTKRLEDSSTLLQAVRPLLEAHKWLARSGLEPVLLDFVSTRASQINGCALCLAMHWREAVEHGESGDRLMGLPAWREASWYSERERAALEWTEALTTVSDGPIEDELFARMRAAFDERELVALTLAVNLINVWNRFNIAFRTPPEMAEAALAQMRGAVA